ncbi:MAG TPA: glycosyltransferase family 2 protein [Thermoanaerobaculia bacterium]|nr:glycosyltransferase family 2 protein [Thermoanaerobaculia bacterium]
MTPLVSVVIASDRVNGALSQCLASLTRQSRAPAFEVVVASATAPASRTAFSFPVEWVPAESRNPALRRNVAARRSRGAVLAFLDDDAEAEAGWLEAGARSVETAAIVGGPDLGPAGAPYRERISDLLLATPFIGSGVPAHERQPRRGSVASPHDVALCNLFVRREAFDSLGGFDESLGYMGEDTDFVRRALERGFAVVLDPDVRVRHRRRPFPTAYIVQRWRYRVKTGRLLVLRPGLHPRGRIAAFLSAGFAATAGVAAFGLPFLVPAALLYAAVTWTLSFPIWRDDPALFPAVPFAFALHHLTYFAGLLTGIARGLIAVAVR